MSKYSDALANQYSKLRGSFSAIDEKVFSILGEIGVKDKRVLDFGSGDGRYSFRIGELSAKEVIGIDISQAMIKIADHELRSREAKNIKFIEADGNNLPFEDNSFDFVFSHFVLLHFKNTLEPLQEIARVLKPSGYLVATFNTYEVTAGKEELLNTEVPMRLGNNEDSVVVNVYVKSDKEMHQNLEIVGFREVKYEKTEKPDSIIDPSYPHLNSVKKSAVICLAQKV